MKPSKSATRFLGMSLATLAAAAMSQTPSPEEPFLRRMLLKHPSIQAESLAVAGSVATREGAASLLLPQFKITGALDANTDLDGTRNAVGQAAGTASQLLPTGGTLSGAVSTQRRWTATPTRTVSAYSQETQSLAEAIGFALPPATATVGGSSVRDTLGVELAFTQPLLKGFGKSNNTFYSADQAVLAQKVQTQTSRAQILALISQGRKAWWNQRASEALLAARSQDTVRTQRLLVATRQKRAVGAASDLDTLQAWADHLQARSDWLSAWTSARSGAINLGSFLDTTEVWIGSPGDTALLLPPAIPLTTTGSPDSLLALAQAGAPDIAQAMALEEKARSEELYRARQGLPQLDAGVYARKGLLPEDANPSGIQYGARATLEWNIPDGVNRAAARKAMLELRKSGIATVKARRDLKRTLIRLSEQQGFQRQSLELSLLVIQAQAARLQAAETGYRDGSVSWSDLALARRDWLNALTSAWNSVATLQSGESDLQSLTGTGPSALGWNWGN